MSSGCSIGRRADGGSGAGGDHRDPRCWRRRHAGGRRIGFVQFAPLTSSTTPCSALLPGSLRGGRRASQMRTEMAWIGIRLARVVRSVSSGEAGRYTRPICAAGVAGVSEALAAPRRRAALLSTRGRGGSPRPLVTRGVAGRRRASALAGAGGRLASPRPPPPALAAVRALCRPPPRGARTTCPRAAPRSGPCRACPPHLAPATSRVLAAPAPSPADGARDGPLRRRRHAAPRHAPARLRTPRPARRRPPPPPAIRHLSLRPLRRRRPRAARPPARPLRPRSPAAHDLRPSAPRPPPPRGAPPRRAPAGRRASPPPPRLAPRSASPPARPAPHAPLAGDLSPAPTLTLRSSPRQTHTSSSSVAAAPRHPRAGPRAS